MIKTLEQAEEEYRYGFGVSYDVDKQRIILVNGGCSLCGESFEVLETNDTLAPLHCDECHLRIAKSAWIK